MAAARPLISVTLPNYNYAHFLTEALESVLVQSYEHFELLVTEDGSTDDSRDIIERFARRDPRIKPVYFPENRGVQAAHADTWQRATGALVFQFSSDDALCDPEFFRLAVEALEAHPQAAGFYGVAATISTETGEDRGPIGFATPQGYVEPAAFLRGFLTRHFFVPGISSIWRKPAIDALGGYDAELGPQTDYFINHALPARAGVVFMARTFARARMADRKTGYSSGVSIEDEARRMALFERRMREATTALTGFDTAWDAWRQQQALLLQAKHSP
jgi:glycosyltransferase involved in cell wall biosynthesis